MLPPLLFHCATDSQGNPYPLPPPLCRGIPDVAAQSGDVVSNGYTVTMSGNDNSAGGGTSLSSPLWLRMVTRPQPPPAPPNANCFPPPPHYPLPTSPPKPP